MGRKQPYSRAELDQSTWHLVRAEVGHLLSSWMTWLGVILALALVVGLFVVDAKGNAVLVLLIAAGVIPALAAWQVADRLHLAFGRPTISVEPAPATLNGGIRQFVRIRVANAGATGCVLDGKVFDQGGLEGPEAPWPLVWRHGGRSSHRLHTDDDQELVDLLKVEVNHNTGRANARFNVVDDNGTVTEWMARLDPTVQLTVAFWDAESSQPAGRYKVVVPDTLKAAEFTVEQIDP